MAVPAAAKTVSAHLKGRVHHMKHQKISGIYADSAAFDGKSITVCGWARSIRDNKHFGFIALNDGSCFKPL